MRRASLACLLTAACAAASCRGPAPDPETAAALARLDERTAALAHRQVAFEVATVCSQLDDMDFFELVQRLSREGRGRPGDASRMRGAARAVKHAAWPPELRQEADLLVPVLDDLAVALAGKDWDGARSLAPAALNYQQEFVRTAHGWLDREDPWVPGPVQGHVHGVGQAHADHDPHHGGQLGMVRDLHLELAPGRAGELRVYLSDAVRAPVSAEGVTGELVLRPDAPDEVTLPLARVAADALGAAGASVHGPTLVTVRLSGTPEGDVEMDFQVDPGAAPTPASDGARPQRAAATQPAVP